MAAIGAAAHDHTAGGTLSANTFCHRLVKSAGQSCTVSSHLVILEVNKKSI